MWKILRTVSKGDYTYAVVPTHPAATKNGYVLEHRIVMENQLGRLLTSNEVVHHINGDKKDNRIENLELLTNQQHTQRHMADRTRAVVYLRCPQCRTVFIRDKHQTFLSKPGTTYTCCSRSCSGKLSRRIQVHGMTSDIQEAIRSNVVQEGRVPATLTPIG